MDQITLLTLKLHLGEVKKKVLEIGLMTDDARADKDAFWNVAIKIVKDIDDIDELIKLEMK
jgi:hypothetical protein